MILDWEKLQLLSAALVLYNCLSALVTTFMSENVHPRSCKDIWASPVPSCHLSLRAGNQMKSKGTQHALWIANSQNTRPMDGNYEQDNESQDWGLLVSNVMEELVHCFEGKTAYRKMVGVLRRVSSSWRRAVNKSLSSIEAREVDATIVANALTSQFTRADALVLNRCYGYVNRKFGETVQHTQRIRSLHISPVAMIGASADEELIAAIGLLENLRDLSLWGPLGMTGSGLKHIASLTSLTEISLGSRLDMRGEDFSALLPLQSLKVLNLEGCCSLGDVGLRFLGRLRNLVEVSVEIYNGTSSFASAITQTGLSSIAQLPNLIRLTLRGCELVEDRDLAGLTQSASLQELQMERCVKITDQGLCFLGMIQSLSHISMRDCRRVSNRAVEALSQLTSLKSLLIGDCWGVSDSVVGSLASMTSMESLTLIRCTLFTDAGLRALARLDHIQNFKLLGIGGGISVECLSALSLECSLIVDWHAWECYIAKVQHGREDDIDFLYGITRSKSTKTPR